MNFSILKDIIEIVSKLFKYCKDHRIVNLVKLGIMLMIFYMCFSEFYLKSRYGQEAKRNNIISEKIGDIVSNCGVNSFVSWETIEDTRASVGRKTIRFNDVVGCLSTSKKDCPVSVRYSNPAYLKDHTLSYDDYDYLKNTTNGMLVRCDIIAREVICPGYTPGILNTIVKLTNLELSDITYVVVSDWQKNIVYVFTLSYAKNSINTCSMSGGNMYLDNLAKTAMENLK